MPSWVSSHNIFQLSPSAMWLLPPAKRLSDFISLPLFWFVSAYFSIGMSTCWRGFGLKLCERPWSFRIHVMAWIVESKNDDFEQFLTQDMVGCKVAAEVGGLDIVCGVVTNNIQWSFVRSLNDKIWSKWTLRAECEWPCRRPSSRQLTLCFCGHAKEDSASGTLLEGSAVVITIDHACWEAVMLCPLTVLEVTSDQRCFGPGFGWAHRLRASLHLPMRIGNPLLNIMQLTVFMIVRCILSTLPLDAGLLGSVNCLATPVSGKRGQHTFTQCHRIKSPLEPWMKMFKFLDCLILLGEKHLVVDCNQWNWTCTGCRYDLWAWLVPSDPSKWLRQCDWLVVVFWFVVAFLLTLIAWNAMRFSWPVNLVPLSGLTASCSMTS